MPIAFTAPAEVGPEVIQGASKSAIDQFGIAFTLTDADRVPRILVRVSRLDRCLQHLLYQIRVGVSDAVENSTLRLSRWLEERRRFRPRFIVVGGAPGIKAAPE